MEVGVSDVQDDASLFEGLSEGERWLARHVRTMLGYPVMSVELCRDHYAAIVEDTVLWYQTHKAQVAYRAFRVSHGQREYDVPDDVTDVVEVIFPERSDSDNEITWDISSYGSLREIPYALWSVQQGGGLMSGIMLEKVYYDMLSRVLSSEPSWEWHRTTRKLIVKVPEDWTGTAIYGYNLNRMRWEVLGPDDKMLLRMYAVGKGKILLGEIRSKYSDYPAAGGRVSLNGETLFSQGIEDVQNAEEKMRNLAVPMPFLTG